MEYRSTLKETIPSRNSWWLQKIKILPRRRVESFIDTIVTGWSVMRNILVNPQEHLERGSKNIRRLLPQYMTIFITTGHSITIDYFSIKGRDLNRAIKEAVYIRVNNPSLNRNIGKYHLAHIWDEVLFNTSELKLN